jgi:protein TonB
VADQVWALVVAPVKASVQAYSESVAVSRLPFCSVKWSPEYTEEARAAKYQGTVLLSVEIDPNGNATNIKVQHALGLGLDEKAIEAVRQWKFKPGQKDGKPVTVAASIEVNFRL